jgi:hypothetical protein
MLTRREMIGRGFFAPAILAAAKGVAAGGRAAQSIFQ